MWRTAEAIQSSISEPESVADRNGSIEVVLLGIGDGVSDVGEATVKALEETDERATKSLVRVAHCASALLTHVYTLFCSTLSLRQTSALPQRTFLTSHAQHTTSTKDHLPCRMRGASPLDVPAKGPAQNRP